MGKHIARALRVRAAGAYPSSSGDELSSSRSCDTSDSNARDSMSESSLELRGRLRPRLSAASLLTCTWVAGPLAVLVAVRLALVVGACAAALFTLSAILVMTMALAAVGSALLMALVLSQALTLSLSLHFKLQFRQPGTASGAAACVTVLLGWFPRQVAASGLPWRIVERLTRIRS